MKKSILSRTIAMVLAIAMLSSGLIVFADGEQLLIAANPNAETVTDASDSSYIKVDEIQEILNALSYDEYRLRLGEVPDGKDVVVIAPENFNKELTTADVTVYDSAAFAEELREGFTYEMNDLDDYESPLSKKKAEIENSYLAAYLEQVLESANFDGKVIESPSVGQIAWDFEIKSAGLYNVQIEYTTINDVKYVQLENGETAKIIKNNTNDIERSVLIDGTYPYKESRTVAFTKCWHDLYDESSERKFLLDFYDNELRPEKLLFPEWTTTMVYDSSGYYGDPLLYYLDEGAHTLTLDAIMENMIIKSIKIYREEKIPSYAEYKEANAKYSSPDVEPVKIAGEHSIATSDQTIYALNDRTSAINEPQDPSKVLLNTIGGTKWSSDGQWIRWEFEVPEDGLYKIIPRFLQAEYAGVYVSRKLYIDGKVPFEEAKNIKFNYSDDWQTAPIGNAACGDFEFYLEKGKHTIQLEVVLGDMADILNQCNTSLLNMNKMYLKILMITGSKPDTYRDYGFEKLIPEVLEGLLEEAERIYGISAELESITGSKGDHSVLLDKIAFILEKMGSNGDNVAGNLSKLKDNIGQLGSWISTTQSQPLTIDYIQVQPADIEEIPEANAGFFKALWHELKSFIMSFFSNYDSLGAMEEIDQNAENVIDVWLATGRDQSNIVRSMLDDFTIQTGIQVNLRLVAGGTLLPAVLSGNGPDVSLSETTGNAINYAIRNAVLPINDMEGFDDVIKRFDDTALIPLTLFEETYGLPETQHFSVLFYRMDVLAELGIDLPRTWDDLYDILPVLQSNNLEFGMPKELAGLTLMLYQTDEPMYTPALDPNDPVERQALIDAGIDPDDKDAVAKTEGMSVNLNSNTSLSVFKQMCEFFTMYGFPYTFDFANRFRTGEMPMAIADYTSYNQLTIFAPEISGLWGIATVPGTATYKTDENGEVIYGEDGKKIVESINNNAPATVTTTIMLRSAIGQEEQAWKFMKWWTDEPQQTVYGNELLAVLGASGRHPTANLESLANQPWPADIFHTLEEQFDHLSITPEMPGGYILTRYVQFAFLAAYNDNDDPVEAMLSYIDSINSELSRKRQEFDLPILEDFPNLD